MKNGNPFRLDLQVSQSEIDAGKYNYRGYHNPRAYYFAHARDFLQLSKKELSLRDSGLYRSLVRHNLLSDIFGKSFSFQVSGRPKIKLNSEQKTLLQLCLQVGIPERKIAKILHCHPQTLKKYMTREGINF